MAATGAAESFTFFKLCNELGRIEGAANGRDHGLNSKRAIARHLFDQYSKHGRGQQENMHPLLRLLVPGIDSKRGNYSLKEAKLGSELAAALGGGPDLAEKMSRWNSTSTAKATGLRGDFADFASAEILRERCKESEGWTIAQVNGWLDRLAAVAADKAPTQADERQKLFVEATRALSAFELKWIIRIILRNMRIGIKEMSMLKAYHRHAEELFSQRADLEAMCVKCADPSFKFALSDMQLFTPVCSMLASAITVDARAMAKLARDVLVEQKFDGERLQAHVDVASGRVVWYTRNRKDFSKHYGADMDPVVKSCLRPRVTSAILDGEMLAWDADAQRYCPFGENRTMNVQHRRGQGEHQQPCYKVFDLLYLNGENLTDQPLRERKRLLRECVLARDEPRRLELVEGSVVRSALGNADKANEVMALLDQSMIEGHEGLVLKALDGDGAAYTPDRRGWHKVKPDYQDGWFQTLDLVVIGGYYGSAHTGQHWKSGGVSHFLLGLLPRAGTAVPPGTSEDPVITFGKVGTGYTAEELAEIRRRLKPYERPFDRQSPPPHFLNWTAQTKDDWPTVWYPLKETLVFEIKAYEITEAEPEKWKAGLCLRFPRVECVRWTKEWHEAESLVGVQKLHKELKDKGLRLSTANKGAAIADAAEGGAGVNDGGARHKKKRRVDAQPSIQTAAALTGGGVAVRLNLFHEHRIWVAVDDDEGELGALWTLALSLGAQPVRNQVPTMRYVLVLPKPRSGAQPLKVQNCLRKAVRDKAAAAETPSGAPSFDVVTSEWLRACERAGRLVPLEPRFTLFTSPATDFELSGVMDAYGDRYAEDASVDELRAVLRLVREREGERDAAGAPRSVAEVVRAIQDDEVCYELDPPPRGALRTPHQCVAYMLAEHVLSPPDAHRPQRGALALCAARLRLLGARVTHELSDSVTHCVFPSTGEWASDAKQMLAQLRKRRPDGGAYVRKRFVRSTWVDACWNASAWVAEASHESLICAASAPGVA